MPTQIGIFAKHWTPGRVKTRLAATQGEQTAAAVAHCFIKTLLRRLDAAADRRVLGFAPAEHAEAFHDLARDRWEIVPQCEGDLGQRMRHYFDNAFQAGCDRIVLLGADSPNLPLSTVESAFQALETARLVLSPTDDGGYCLIGASREAPPVFERMPWSEPSLWQATVNRLDNEGWRQGEDWHALAPWYDVDTADDLSRLRRDLADENGDAPLMQLRNELAQLLAD